MKGRMLIILLILQSFLTNSQIVFKYVDMNKQDHFNQLKKFFSNHITVDFGPDSGSIRPELLKVYDSAISHFFNHEEMIKEFNDYKEGRQVEFLKYYQYRALNGIDKAIDYIQEDSIFVMKKIAYLEIYEPTDTADIKQAIDLVLGGFIINGDHYPLIEMKFDKSNKLIFIMPLLYFEKDKAKIINDFMIRQKNRS